jgi:ankyrin repeat protein
VENKCEGVLRVFVENKVDLNVKDFQGRRALFLAVRSGNIGVVKYLLEASVDVNFIFIHNVIDVVLWILTHLTLPGYLLMCILRSLYVNRPVGNVVYAAYTQDVTRVEASPLFAYPRSL